MMNIAKSETFKNFTILNKALLFLIRLGLATRYYDSSLRLKSCMFVPNFEAIGQVTLVFMTRKPPESLA